MSPFSDNGNTRIQLNTQFSLVSIENTLTHPISLGLDHSGVNADLLEPDAGDGLEDLPEGEAPDHEAEVEEPLHGPHVQVLGRVPGALLAIWRQGARVTATARPAVGHPPLGQDRSSQTGCWLSSC